jgi:hypothetical protein
VRRLIDHANRGNKYKKDLIPKDMTRNILLFLDELEKGFIDYVEFAAKIRKLSNF